MDPVELEVNRLNTTAFIAAKPSEIVMSRAEQRRTPSGGKLPDAAVPVPVQTFRVIEQAAPSAPQIVQLTDGTARVVNFWLLGEWDADVQRGDSWREGGRDWTVGDIIRDNGYEVRALVVESGGGER
jgi:hypothetical protein